MSSIIIDDSNPNTYVVSKLNNMKYLRITHKHVKKYNMSLQEYCDRFNLSNTDIICNKLKEKLGFTLERSILKYGDDLGKIKWKEYCKKQAHSNTYEYKKERHNMSLEEFNIYNKSRSVTLENLIKRHGEKKGTEKWNAYCLKQAKSGCSLDYFIEKYGKNKGTEVYEKVCKSKSTSLASFISKYGKEEGIKRYNSRMSEKTAGYSKISQELFKELKKYSNNKIYFAEVNNGIEYHVLDIENGRSYFYDYVDVDFKKCIEFNGDVFHGNPDMFKENDTPNPYLKISCNEIWKYDNEKINHLKKTRDIDTLIVWESDYKKNKEEVLKKCLNFLQYEY